MFPIGPFSQLCLKSPGQHKHAIVMLTIEDKGGKMQYQIELLTQTQQTSSLMLNSMCVATGQSTLHMQQTFPIHLLQRDFKRLPNKSSSKMNHITALMRSKLFEEVQNSFMSK